MNQLKYCIIILFAINLLVFSSMSLYGQDNGKSIEVRVNDINQNPIPNAKLWLNEGSDLFITNDQGIILIKAEANEQILFEASGFESDLITVPKGAEQMLIELKAIEFQKGKTNTVQIPFGEMEKISIPGSVTSLNVEEIMKFDASQSTYGIINGRVPGIFGNTDVRGLGNALIVVDGIPRPELSLNPDEIDEITVLRDIGSSILYGAQGHQGVILIKTKRGIPNKKIVNIRLETGFDMAKSYPSYLSAGEYMELYNEALLNDEKPKRYSDGEIQNTKDGVDPMLYPDESFYDGRFLRDYRPFQRLVSEFSGGNTKASYYANVGYLTTGSFFTVGEGANERSNLINIRGNTNYELNNWISFHLDGVAIFNTQNGVEHNFWDLSTSLKPNAYPFLIPTNRLVGNPVLETATIINGNSILGGSTEFRENIYGQMNTQGFRKQMDRTIQFSSGLDLDLEWLIDGLTGSFNFTFDMSNSFTSSLVNEYAVYFVRVSNPIGSDTLKINPIGLDDRASKPSTSDVDFLRRTGMYGTLDYKKNMGGHNLNVTAVSYRDQLSLPNETQLEKHLHFGLRANYSYDEKYILELNSSLAGSSKLFGSNKWGLSPALSAAWILSEEDFLASNSFINFLKLKGGYGISSYDTDIGYYQYLNEFSAQGSFEYGLFSQYENNIIGISSLGNPELDFVKRKELNFGIETLLFSNFFFEAGYFNSKISGDVVQVNNVYPSYIGDVSLFLNYESEKYSGLELGFQYTKKTDLLELSLGGNLITYSSENLIVDEPDYEDSYRSRIGNPTDGLYGLVADGLFQEADFTNGILNENLPVPNYNVQAGDIKYIDQNDDGLINEKDIRNIGKSHAKNQISLNLLLKHKALSLYIMGTGQRGGNVYFNNDYYWVQSNDKYSESVLNRWTPSTAETADYPRLSTEASPNNFRNSTYWLYDNNWFQLRTVQLSWDLPAQFMKSNFIKYANIYIRGGDLFMISKIKKQKELNVGKEPNTRNLRLGLNVTF